MVFEQTTLGNVSKGGKGNYGIAASAVDYSDELYTYLRITDIKDDGTIDFGSLKSVNDEKAANYILQPNDIVFARTGASTGRNYFYDGSDGQFVYAGFLIKFSIDPTKVNPKYVKYYCLSQEYRGWIASYNTGSTRGNINAQTLAQMPLLLPERMQQDKMVDILSSIDQKIKENEKINKNLEQQAKAVFKSWFEDFDPFDEPLIETPAGIYAPASLQMVQIANIPHVLETGKRPKGGAVASGVPSIGAENVKQLGVVNFSSAKFIPEEFAEKMKTGAINGYELLLYKDGGKPGTFIPHFSMFGEGFPYQKFFINEHVFKLDFGDKGFNEFAYFFMQTDYAYHWLASNGGKAAVPGINQQNVKDIWIFSPENSKVKEFGEWVQPLFTTILKNCAQNVKLAELRDTLLPKLMSGELDVSDIEL